MLRALPWIVVAVLLALWSLIVWALHAAGAWTLSQAGDRAGVAAALDTLQGSLPAASAWLPPEVLGWLAAIAAGAGPVLDHALAAAPSLTGGLTVAAWLTWGLGSALLLALAGLAHGLAGTLRRRTCTPMPPTPRVPSAG